MLRDIYIYICMHTGFAHVRDMKQYACNLLHPWRPGHRLHHRPHVGGRRLLDPFPTSQFFVGECRSAAAVETWLAARCVFPWGKH